MPLIPLEIALKDRVFFSGRTGRGSHWSRLRVLGFSGLTGSGFKPLGSARAPPSPDFSPSRRSWRIGPPLGCGYSGSPPPDLISHPPDLIFRSLPLKLSLSPISLLSFPLSLSTSLSLSVGRSGMRRRTKKEKEKRRRKRKKEKDPCMREEERGK